MQRRQTLLRQALPEVFSHRPPRDLNLSEQERLQVRHRGHPQRFPLSVRMKTATEAGRMLRRTAMPVRMRILMKNGKIRYTGGPEIMTEPVIREIFDANVRIISIDGKNHIITEETL